MFRNKLFFAGVAVVLMFGIVVLAGQPKIDLKTDNDGISTIESAVAAGSTQTYPPGILFSTLLDNVKLIARDGSFRLGNKMQNVFMPDGATGKAVVSKADGKVVFYWEWKLDTFGMKAPYKLFGFQQPLKADGSRLEYTSLKLTEPGKYNIDFFNGEKKFYTMPFSVRVVEPANPFDGGKKYLFDGPWNDWGYLYYADVDPEQNLAWKIWMRDEAPKSQGHDVTVNVVRDKDKKLICQSRPNMTKTFRNDWVRNDFDLVNPPVKTSGGAYFKAKDLLAVDGGYTLTMKIDGVEYGVWKFTVAGGKLSYIGETERGKADSMTFVEGGKDAFWYKRQ
jgi:hypothetical protein